MTIVLFVSCTAGSFSHFRGVVYYWTSALDFNTDLFVQICRLNGKESV